MEGHVAKQQTPPGCRTVQASAATEMTFMKSEAAWKRRRRSWGGAQPSADVGRISCWSWGLEQSLTILASGFLGKFSCKSFNMTMSLVEADSACHVVAWLVLSLLHNKCFWIKVKKKNIYSTVSILKTLDLADAQFFETGLDRNHSQRNNFVFSVRKVKLSP